MAKVLIIGDSKYILSNIIDSFQRLGHSITIAKTNTEGLSIIDKHYDHFDIIVLDKVVTPVPGIRLLTNFLVSTKMVIGAGFRGSQTNLKPLYCYITNASRFEEFRPLAKLGVSIISSNN